MISITQSSQVIFLLGAGASKNAGIPTTYDFVTQFINYIEESTELNSKDKYHKKKLINSIVETLRQWKKLEGDNVDIELLLETLTKLKNRNKESLLQFCADREDSPTLMFIDQELSLPLFDELIEEIINNLKVFIKFKTIVKEDNIGYLKYFRGFIETAKNKGCPLDIISLNYDTCIEQFCNAHKMTYQDGFDLYWNPDAFKRDDTDVRLYKLHGSVIWYQSDRGTYIKLPIQNEFGEIKLISDEKAENLMLYPMQKWDYAEPLLELLLYVKDLLESKISDKANTDDFKFLVVAGYSFRDEHIKQVIFDAARRNRKLYLIIIDPNSNQIYDERLKYYDNLTKILSHLNGKVVCLPYKFESVFPFLMDKYVNKLKSGLLEIESMQRKEDLAEETRWINCIFLLAEAEFSELVDKIIDNKSIVFDKSRTRFDIQIFLSIAVNLLYNNQRNKANKYLVKFYDGLWDFLNESMPIKPEGFIGTFDYGSGSTIIFRMGGNIEYFYKTLRDLKNYCEIRLNEMCLYRDEEVVQLALMMELCIEYLGIFSNQSINEFILSIKDYIIKREDYLNILKRYIIETHFDIIGYELTEVGSKLAKLKVFEMKNESEMKAGGVTNMINEIERTLINILYKTLNPEFKK